MEPGAIGSMIAGGLLAALAGVLLALDPRGAATRAFAFLLTARGVGGVVSALSVSSDPFLAANGALYLQVLAVLGAVAALRFTFVYPRPSGWLGGRRGLWTLVAAGAGSAVATVAARERLVSFDGGSIVAPLAITLPSVFYITLLFVALHAFWKARREVAAEVRRSLGLVAIALLLDSAFASASIWEDAAAGSDLDRALAAATAALLLVALGVLSREARGVSPMRGIGRAGLVLLPVAAAVGWLWAADVFSGVVHVVVRNLGRVPMALVVVYALVRHRIFGVDLKIKFTIRQSTVAALFVGVFFVVSEAAQQVFQESAGPYLGIAAAGALLFALAPLQRVAERLADRAMPHVHDHTRASLPEKRELYRSAYTLARADGVLTEDEERHLAKLASMLGLSHEDVFETRRASDAASVGTSG